MARRASSSPNPFRVILGIAALALLAGGGYLLYAHFSDPYRIIPPLPVAKYLQNSNNLDKNTYTLRATVGNSLANTGGTQRLFAVDSEAGEPLAVLIPSSLSQLNIEPGQRFIFKVSVKNKGVLEVQDARKL